MELGRKATFQTRWVEFAQSLNSLKQVGFQCGAVAWVLLLRKATQDLHSVTEYAAQTSNTLSLALLDANNLSRVQHHAWLAVDKLAETVEQLTDATHEEFISINGSAYMIKEYLREQRGKEGLWKDWARSILSLVSRGSFLSLASNRQNLR